MTDTQTFAGRIRKAAYGIQDAYDDALEPARRTIESHALCSLVNPPLPISAVILDARADACETLDRWYIHIRTARRLNVGIERWDVPTLTRFLVIHCEFLGESVDGARAAHELEMSSDALKEIAQGNAPRKFKVGRCPGMTNGLQCPGSVRATVRSDDDLLPSELACDAVPRHVWPAGEWRVLERRLHASATAARRATVVRGSHVDEGAARRLLVAIRMTG